MDRKHGTYPSNITKRVFGHFERVTCLGKCFHYNYKIAIIISLKRYFSSEALSWSSHPSVHVLYFKSKYNLIFFKLFTLQIASLLAVSCGLPSIGHSEIDGE